MALINLRGVLWPTGLTLEARVYPPGGGSTGEGADLALTEDPAGSGQYGVRGTKTLADTAGTDPYEIEVRQVAGAGTFAASTTVALGRGTLGWCKDDDWISGPHALDDRIFTEARAEKLSLIGAIGGEVSTTAVAIDADLEVRNFTTWRQSFSATGVDSTGWEAFAFTVKRSNAGDSDAEALLCVRETNPGAVDDGLLVLNGVEQPAADAGNASIVVGLGGGDTTVDVEVKAAAMGLPASGNSSYTWELTRWLDGEKETIGSGKFKVVQSVRRTVAIP